MGEFVFNWTGKVHVPAIPNWLIGKEFHALLLSFFPALLSTSYKLCKLGGPYNNELIVLTSDNDASQHPHWSPESLRPVIGNKAQLIIQPQEEISRKARDLGNPEVSFLK